MVKRYIVTGASSGIGLAVVRALLSRGHAVTGVARREAAAAIARTAPGTGKFDSVICDLGDEQALGQTFAAILDRGSNLHGVVLCHGYGDFGNIEEFSTTRIRNLLTVNLVSYLMICRQVVPHLKTQGYGDIVFIGSESGLRAGKKGAAYSAAKFGLRGLAGALRAECTSNGVRVCMVNPGLVQTPFFDDLDFAPGTDRANYLRPEEVATAVDLALALPAGAVLEEINLAPQKKVIQKKTKPRG